MANYIQKFQNQSAYDAAEHQYPNTSLVGSDVVFQMSAPTPAFGGLTVKYNISDPTQEVTLFSGGGASSGSSESSSESGGGGALPTTMIVDGVSETPINTWRFETAGEHIVQYEFADNIIPAGFLNDSVATATEAIIGDDITEISFDSGTGNGAFTSSNLTTATIGNGVTTIGENAFAVCINLVTVTIGTGITTIGDSAFANSNLSLASVTVKATTPPELGGGVFNESANNMVIYVPAESVETYKAAINWSDYALYIQPIV